MERRSGRLKSLPPRILTDDGTDAEMSDYAEAETSAAAAAVSKKSANPRKRLKVSPTIVTGIQKKPRRKRGLLKDVVGMPMDVLYEIFSQLDPMDLLNLARTTKDLRRILMSPSSKSVWKQAFTNVSPPGLPDCPSDLTEPQYAELAFGKGCSFCDRKVGTIHIVWEARFRTCNKCLDAKFTQDDLYYDPHALRDHLPGIVVQRPYGRRRHCGRLLVYVEAKTQWRREYQALDASARQVWLDNKVAERQLIRQHSKLCESWVESRQTHLENQKAAIIEERKATVMEYICGLGWEEELEKIPSGIVGPENDPTIHKFCLRDITQLRLDSLTEYLNEYMEGIQTKRIFREQKEVLQAKLVTLKETYNSYLLTLPPTEFYPNTADLYRDESVKEILKGSAELSADQLDILNAMFPELLETWREPIMRKLVELVSEGATTEKFVFDPSSVLSLVATAFVCQTCNLTLQAKQTITHHCTRDTMSMYAKMPDEEQEMIKNTIKEIHWNAANYLKFSPTASKRIAEALEACSFDPTTTVEQLEKLDPIFECLACHNVLSGRCMMRWTGLYSHSTGFNGHNSARPMKLIVVTGEDAIKARARMDEEFERHHAREHRSSLCTHCRMHGGLLGMLEHVKSTHEIAKPKPGVDVIIAPGAAPQPDVFRLWPPRLKEDVEEMMGEPQNQNNGFYF